jgi:hypothetical protein
MRSVVVTLIALLAGSSVASADERKLSEVSTVCVTLA